MKTRTQLILSVLGLSLFITLPVVAQKKPAPDSSNSTPSSVEPDVPATTKPTVQDREKPNTSVEVAPVEQDVPATTKPTVQGREKPNTSVEAAPAAGNLVEKAASSQNFQTLAKAIKAAGLEETLAGKGPYTVFAPTDAAFAALPPGILEQLLKPENKEVLVELLKLHVVPGAVTSGQIQSGKVETLAGTSVAVQKGKDGKVTVNEANVTQADIQATNGVIHGIDKVILPQETQSQSQTQPKPFRQN
jgi:uncharacterized surface protein with fasciclin (FAS1) repeats